jgi:hypothetical protein
MRKNSLKLYLYVSYFEKKKKTYVLETGVTYKKTNNAILFVFFSRIDLKIICDDN